MTTVLEHAGGLEKYLIETASNLAKQPNIEADVITLDNNFTDRFIGALSLFYFKKIDKRLSYKESLKDIRKRLGEAHYFKERNIKELRKRLQDYDVIYSKNELLEAFIFRLLLRYKTLPPVVFGGHTPLYYPNPVSLQAKLHNFLYGGVVYRFLAGGVTKFHALNNNEADLYRQLFPGCEVVKIYNPFDVMAFRKTAQGNVYPAKRFREDSINLLWVGRMTEQKGVHNLALIISSVNQNLADSDLKISWNIFGDGELKSEIQELVKVQSNVNYFGHVDQKYMASIYKQNHFFISTSKWEGYPYTLVEAQAFGLRIFAYDIPGVSDILDVYDGGYLAKSSDDVISALTRALLKHGNSKKVQNYNASDQFNPNIIYGQLLNLLKVNA